MKKILMLVLVAGAAAFAKKKMDEGKSQQNQWANATDPVKPA